MRCDGGWKSNQISGSAQTNLALVILLAVGFVMLMVYQLAQSD